MKPLRLAKPHIIVMLGIAGSGKTFFADQFANTFHAPFIHYDKMAEIGNLSSAAVHRIAAYQLGELLKTNQSIVIEGIAQSRADRLTLVKRAKALDYEVLFVWVQTDPVAAMQRTMRGRTQEGRRAIDAGQYEREANSFVMPQPADNVVVISGKHTFASQAKAVLSKLSTPRDAAPEPRRVRQKTTRVQSTPTATAKAKGRRAIAIK